MQPNQESLELTLSNIENLSTKNQEFAQELQLLYDAINDYPKLGIDSISNLKQDLENEGLKSFRVEEIKKFQKSLSATENAWIIESLESVIAFCSKVEENDFVNAVQNLKQKLRVA